MNLLNVIGDVHGRMTITAELPIRSSHNRRVLAQCECGAIKEVILGSLRSGRTTSCGCYQKEVSTTHGQSQGNNMLYYVWASLKSRCNDTGAKNYHKYGGRGITVCPEWNASFEVFQAWAEVGYAAGLTLDRRRNNEGYSPDNCRWATPTVQSRNRRSAAGSSSQYIGVYRCNTRQVWVAQITVNKKRKTLGLHETELAAAITRDQYIINQGLSDFQMNNVL